MGANEESHSIREAETAAGFCPPLPLFCSFFLHPFHLINGYFVFVFTGQRGEVLRQRQQEGKQKMLRPQNKSLRLQFREYWGGMGLEGVQGRMGTRSASMAGTHPIPFWTPSWPRWQSWANHNG